MRVFYLTIPGILHENALPFDSEPETSQNSDMALETDESDVYSSDEDFNLFGDNSSSDENINQNESSVIERINSNPSILNTVRDNRFLERRRTMRNRKHMLMLLAASQLSFFSSMIMLMILNEDSLLSEDSDSDDDAETSRFEELDSSESVQSNESASSYLPDSQFLNYNHTQNNSSLSNQTPTPIENDNSNVSQSLENNTDLQCDIEFDRSNTIQSNEVHYYIKNDSVTMDSHSDDNQIESHAIFNINDVSPHFNPNDANQMETEDSQILEEEYLYEEVEYLDDEMFDSDSQTQVYKSDDEVSYMYISEQSNDNSYSSAFLSSDCINLEESDYHMNLSEI